MLIKTYTAKDVATALLQVKLELGANAIIISNRKIPATGWFSFFRKPCIEVVAGLEEQRDQPVKSRVPELTTREEFQSSFLAPLAREVKAIRDEMLELRKREEQRQLKSEPRQELHEPAFMGGAPERAPEPQPLVSLPVVKAAEAPAREYCRRLLMKSGLTSEECDRFFGDLSIADDADDKQVDEAVRSAIARQTRCGSSLKKKKGAARVIALVGPTGVGKTTTIAKLAGIAYKQDAKVALITIDNFRVGAVQQLKTYSEIMNIPLEVASDANSLAAAVKKHAHCDYILIDTSGRSPMDTPRLHDIKNALSAVREVEVHLCLSATSRTGQTIEAIRRFSELNPSRLLFTKLDESDCYGGILAAHLESRLMLSYFTAGQRVPEDIECASGRRLARLIVPEA